MNPKPFCCGPIQPVLKGDEPRFFTAPGLCKEKAASLSRPTAFFLEAKMEIQECCGSVELLTEQTLSSRRFAPPTPPHGIRPAPAVPSRYATRTP